MSPTACRILFEVDEKDMGKDGLMHLQDQIIGAEMILCPIWSTSEHWTLLAINIEEKEIRYYDSLQPASAMCMMNAMKIIHELKKMAAWDWIPHGLEITIRNAAYQGNGIDCGVYTAHYMEEEIRNWRGEGMGHEWPQILTMRSRIMSITSVLKKHEDKMKEKAAEMEEAKATKEKKEQDTAQEKDKEDTKEDIEKAKCHAPDEKKEKSTKAIKQKGKLTWGCPKCKYNDNGCCKCNPERQKHIRRKKRKQRKKETNGWRRWT